MLDIPVGVEPQDIAAAGGFLWVAHADGSVQALTPEGAPLTTVQTAGGAVALTTDGSRLWVAHRNGTITEIDAGSGAVTNRWTLNCGACLVRGIHWDGQALWISNFAESTLNRLDPSQGAAQTFSAGADSPTTIASDASGILVLHQSLSAQSTVLTRHNRTTGEVLGSIRAAGFPTAVLGNGHNIWLAVRGEAVGTLALYDADTLSEIWHIEAAPINMLLLASGSLWSADFTNDTVTRRDPVSGAVLDVYPAGNLPQALAYDGGFLWVVNRRDNSLTRYWIGN